MDNQRISLRKPSQPWTDPVTGEIYPGGNPNAVPQPTEPYRQPSQYSQNAQTSQGQPYPQDPRYYQQPVQPVQSDRTAPQTVYSTGSGMKFCKYCGGRIPQNAVICTLCGGQVEELRVSPASQQAPQQIIINNNNDNNNMNYNQNGMPMGRMKNKWVALVLCFFFGVFGVHRFYEGKIGTGIIWLFTLGLFGIGELVDFIILLTKPNPYYVRG